MGWFGKRGETVDLTDMKKRGLLPPVSESEVNEDGVVDLSGSFNSSAGESNSSSESGGETGGFGFLSGLAGAGVSSESTESQPDSDSSSWNVGESSSLAGESGSYTERLRRARTSASNLDHLQTKIDDIEYKLERFLERLERMEDKLPD